MYLRFEIEDVRPVPKQRHRKGRNGNIYTPPETVEWQRLVGILAANAMSRAGYDVTRQPCALMVALELKKQRGKPDTDNLIKSVKDAMNKIVYTDDAIVESELSDLVRNAPRYRVVVEIFPLDIWRVEMRAAVDRVRSMCNARK